MKVLLAMLLLTSPMWIMLLGGLVFDRFPDLGDRVGRFFFRDKWDDYDYPDD